MSGVSGGFCKPLRLVRSGPVRRAISELFEEDWVVILACGLGIAYTGLNLAQAIGATLAGAFETTDRGLFGDEDSALAFRLGEHVFDFSQVASSLIAFALVVAAAAFLIKRLVDREIEAESAE